ncbi:MAG: hypothetical protein JRI37_06785 [Deltaproteobacteria bacterium]|nr:hypothetical protein [Deltaproteobacteria bacterium]
MFGKQLAEFKDESYTDNIKSKLSDILLDLHRSLAHQGSAKILDISTGMPAAIFANPYASRSQHISWQEIAQLRFKGNSGFSD